jgi:methylated-DNA-protein-cysteine methyltransferase-like protein
VYDIVKAIPPGQVMTYGEVARAAGLKTPRQVGWALHRNPDESRIPCHRVVFADGSLAPNFAFGGSSEQKMRLLAEGVEFVNGKVRQPNR